MRAPNHEFAPARRAARTTAAHSTLVVDDTSSCRFAAAEGSQKWLRDEIISGPRNVAVERQIQPEATSLKTSHDGYRARFGLIHERWLTLSADGLRLDGEDRLESVLKKPKAYPFVIRFHLHPHVEPSSVHEGRAALLDLPDGTRWMFSAEDMPIAIEESIFFAASHGSHATRQLVIYGNFDQPISVAWTLRAITAEDEYEDTTEEA